MTAVEAADTPATPPVTRRLLALGAADMAGIAEPSFAQRRSGANITISSTGGVLLPGVNDTTGLTATSVRERAFTMPIHAPAYGRPPNWFFDHPSLTIGYLG